MLQGTSAVSYTLSECGEAELGSVHYTLSAEHSRTSASTQRHSFDILFMLFKKFTDQRNSLPKYE